MTILHFQVTEHDIEQYAIVSGDRNPIHLNEKIAKQHGFATTIAHGMLTMAKIWSVISQDFLTPRSIPHQYDVAFLLPVHAGDFIILEVTQNGQEVIFNGTCKDQNVVKGTILLKSTV